MEMLMVITTLPVVMIAVSGVYATLIRDIPRTTRVLQQNTTALNLLEQIRRDMDRALALPGQSGGQNAGERTLLIEQSGRVIRYEFGDGQVVRTVAPPRTAALRAEGSSLVARATSDEPRLWRMPAAVVSWRPWIKDNEAYAVEIHSHVHERVSGHLTKKLAGSHVFFVNGLGAELIGDY